MNGFVFHPDAVADLKEIWEFIAADNPVAADRVLEEIHEAIRSLIPFPQQGHRRSDLSSRPLRFCPLREYLIAYAPAATPRAVLAIMLDRHHARVSPALPTRPV